MQDIRCIVLKFSGIRFALNFVNENIPFSPVPIITREFQV